MKTELRSTLLLLACAGACLAVPPTLDRGIFPIDTTANPYLPDQTWPSAASDGERLLAVWQDVTLSSGNGDIFGTIADTSGRVATPSGIAIAHDAAEQTFPAVAFGESTYLVVWRDKRADTNGDIYGARVDRDGVVLDPQGIRICGVLGVQSEVAVAASDSGWLVVWTDARMGTDVLGARLNWAGRVLDTVPIPIAALYGSQSQPAVAAVGSEFLVVWLNIADGDTSVQGVGVSASGQVVGLPERIAGDMPQGIRPELPSVACCGTDYMVAWHNKSPAGIKACIVTLDRMPSRAFDVVVASAGDPATARCGDGYIVSWTEPTNGYDVYFALIGPDGSVRHPRTSAVSATGAQGRSSAASVGSSSVLVWQDERLLWSYFTAGALIDSAGTIAHTDMMLYRTDGCWGDQRNARVSGNSHHYCAIWEATDPDANTNTSCALLDVNGGRSTAPTALGLAGYDDVGPVVASGDSTHLAVYLTHGATVGVRVTEDGHRLDSQDVVLIQNGGNSAVCFGAHRYLTAATNSGRVLGVMTDEDGRVVGPGSIAIHTDSRTLYYPSAAFDGTNFLVTWCDNNGYIYCKRVDTLGTVIDPQPQFLGQAHRYTGGPDVAYGDSVYLVVWPFYDGSWPEIRAIRLNRYRTVLDSVDFEISDPSLYAFTPSPPRVCFDGRDFVVVYGCDAYHDDSTFAAGVLVAPTGAGGRRFSVRTRSQVAGDIAPDAACGPGGRVLIVYTDVWDQPGPLLGRLRTYGVFLDSLLAVEEPAGGRFVARFLASPNPFRRTTDLRVPRAGCVVILNAAGRIVRELACTRGRGTTWDGRDSRGQAAPPGIYFSRLEGAGLVPGVKLIKLE